jgi:hypothetical protein
MLSRSCHLCSASLDVFLPILHHPIIDFSSNVTDTVVEICSHPYIRPLSKDFHHVTNLSSTCWQTFIQHGNVYVEEHVLLDIF